MFYRRFHLGKEQIQDHTKVLILFLALWLRLGFPNSVVRTFGSWADTENKSSANLCPAPSVGAEANVRPQIVNEMFTQVFEVHMLDEDHKLDVCRNTSPNELVKRGAD